jgi:hypothetical protein
MTRRSLVCLLGLAAAATIAACAGRETAPASTSYDDLVTLFRDWRVFQQPQLVDGVPDYTNEAMAAQHVALSGFQARLSAIDPSGWPIPRQADYHIVRAEMNGLDFDHRVIRPWARDPAFYVTVFTSESDQPAREGHYARGSLELWTHTFPLSERSIEDIGAAMRAIPGLLAQARTNLTGTGRDLWTWGTRSIRRQSDELARLAEQLADPALAGLRADTERARAATDELAAWLDQQAPSKTEPSGIGRDNYDWYLRHVLLLPYTWQDEVTLMERELARALASLAFEEQRNASLPPARPVDSAEEYTRRFDAGVTSYMWFLRNRGVLTVREDMEPALRERAGRFTPGFREFFTEIDHHDPQVMRTHGFHWFDKAWMRNVSHTSPMRQVPLLYNIFNTRTEGHATGWEEMMMQAGLFDDRPRTRELIYILLAQRAARALGDLRMHARLATLEDAAVFTSSQTPRRWLSLDGQLVRGEQHLYLRQPAYGTSYLIGKIQIEQLLADRKRQLGTGFTMQGFMDEYTAAGLIPITLIRWELTGELPPELAAVISGGEQSKPVN